MYLSTDFLLNSSAAGMDRDCKVDPPMTQKSEKSRVQYAWIILFKVDINEEEPFSIVPLKFFTEAKDFPWNFIEGEMSSECRNEICTFSNLVGEFKIFGKVEKGILYDII